MNIKRKKGILKNIKNYLIKYKYIYFIDISRFKSNILYIFKKDCYKNNVILKNIKNTLLKKILNKKLHKILFNSTFLMLSNNINISARIIMNNSIYINNVSYPIFKGAYINNVIYIGRDKLNDLLKIKSKEENIVNIILLLNNYLKNLILKYKIYNNYKILNIINYFKK